jgi:hypothetical protein
MKSEASAIGLIAWLFGPLVWAAHFFVLYGIASFGCTPPEPTRQGAVRFIALILSALALSALIGFLAWHSFGTPRQDGEYFNEGIRDFLRAISNALAALAIIGVAWTAIGVSLIHTCTMPGIDQ